MREIGEELFNQKLFNHAVADVAVSVENQWTAVWGPRLQFRTPPATSTTTR